MPDKILSHTPFLLTRCSRDLRYVYVSKSYAAMLGRTTDDIIGKPLIEVIGAEGFETLRPHLEAVLQGREVEYEVEVNVAGLGPRHFHMIYVPERDEQGQVIGWIASLVDITEHKKAKEEKERLEKLVAEMRLPHANTQIGIWDWDMQADDVSSTPELEAIFGLEPASTRSVAKFIERVHPDDVQELLARRDAAVSAHKTFQLEFRIIRPDGQIRWVMAVGGAVYDKVTGQPIRIMGNAIDITERKASEAQADFQRKELARLMRLATMGGLSGGIAHELRQPLTSILANAQAAEARLAAKYPECQDVKEILDDIIADDLRADHVIHHLRKLLQNGEHLEHVIDMNELITSTLQLLHSELVNKKIRVDTHLKPELPRVTGDSVELQQVLINLIMNATEAMASTPPAERKLSIVTEETREGYIEVSIRDRGPGISSDALKRIGEPFFTTKAGGLGLGLSICSTIVTAHRGRLTVRNDSDGGAVATVSLPKSVRLATAQSPPRQEMHASIA